jgi:hypothetical protein
MHKNTYINIQIKYSHAWIHSHLEVHLPTQPPNHPPTHKHPPKLLTLCMSVLLHFFNLSNVSCVEPKLCFNVKFTKCDIKNFAIRLVLTNVCYHVLKAKLDMTKSLRDAKTILMSTLLITTLNTTAQWMIMLITISPKTRQYL